MATWRAAAEAALTRGDWMHPTLLPAAAFPALLRQAAIEVSSSCTPVPVAPSSLVPVHRAKRARVGDDAVSVQLTPAGRVVRFMALLAHLGTAPWASGRFAANDNLLVRLAASHIRLISHSSKPSKALYELLGKGLDNAQNTIWITNRQQGKTTAIGKFVAALILVAPPVKTLACVYSTKQERAAELVRAARDYLYWMQADGAHPMWPTIEFVRDNDRGFALRVAPGVPPNEVFARPKSPDTCRGDAPSAAFFDEIAFTTPDFWYTFAYPLMQVANRVFTCTTTPPPPKSFFAEFVAAVQQRNEEDDFFFAVVNHSLACENCIADGTPAECCHRLHLVPSWKSLLRFNAMGHLMPRSRRDQMAAEVFGVIGSKFDGFLEPRLLQAAETRQRVTSLGDSAFGVPTIWLAIDPPAHSRSAMGMAAAITARSGQLVVIGLASVETPATEVAALQHIIEFWARKLRAHPLAHPESVIVPIIECNNNEHLSVSLLVALTTVPPVYNGWSDHMTKHVTPGVGAWTTDVTKMASLSATSQLLMEGRFTVAAEVAVTNRESIDKRASAPQSALVIKEMFVQLGQFSYNHRGQITGKINEDAQDDVGMAVLLLVYWRLCILSADANASDGVA